MNTVKLGEVSSFIMGQAPPGSTCNSERIGTPFVKAGEFGAYRPIIREWTTEPLKLAERSDVLICVVGATAGKLNLGEDCAIGRSVAAIRPDMKKLDQFYLYNYLQTWVLRLRVGSQGSAQGVITKPMLGDLVIPLPPLAEQKRIAAILDKADAIRRKRQTAIKLADDFLRATFLDMFGDPKGNLSNKKTIELGKIAEIIMGQSPKGTSYNAVGNGVPLLNGPAEFGNKHPRERQWTTEPTKFAKTGDILFCVRGATAGKMNWADKKYCIGRGLAAIRKKTEISNQFIYNYLEFMYKHFQSTSNGSTFINIPSNVLNTLSVPNPTRKEEVFFASLSRVVETLKIKNQASLKNSEELFNSLTQRAFRGEL